MRQSLWRHDDTEFIRPLEIAQNEFVQVLLTEFRLRPGKKGLVLDVDFDFNSDAIWLRRGKRYIKERLDPVSMKRYQEELESILLDPDPRSYDFNDPAFPFRYGNGGTLPVVRMDNKDYYCLFYRDSHPVGWNIANGGAESLSELL